MKALWLRQWRMLWRDREFLFLLVWIGLLAWRGYRSQSMLFVFMTMILPVVTSVSHRRQDSRSGYEEMQDALPYRKEDPVIADYLCGLCGAVCAALLMNLAGVWPSRMIRLFPTAPLVFGALYLPWKFVTSNLRLQILCEIISAFFIAILYHLRNIPIVIRPVPMLVCIGINALIIVFYLASMAFAIWGARKKEGAV